MSEQPPTYEVGQIVNGHRWTGTVWEPVEATPATAPLGTEGPAPSGGKPIWKRWWVWVAGVVALLLIASLASGGGSGSGTSASSSPTPSASESVNETPSATDTPSDTPTSSEPTTESAAPTPAAKPITYKGSGNKVLKIKKPESGPVIMTTTIKGPSDNNTIYSLDADLQENDLLVNTIGSYRGTAILDKNGEDTTRLKISVSGTWVITIKPLSDARVITTAAKGSKDDVLFYGSDQPAIMTFTSTSGDSNVTAYWYTANDTDLLVNEIGRFKAEAPMSAGPGVIEVSSDGAWTITIAPA